MKRPPLNTSHRKDITPSVEHTAAALGNPGIEVTATTALILFIEVVSGELLHPYLEPGEGTVGVRVEVDHLAPALAGKPVSITAQIDKIHKQRIMLSAQVSQRGTLVMKGFHHRVVVATERFSDSSTGPGA